VSRHECRPGSGASLAADFLHSMAGPVNPRSLTMASTNRTSEVCLTYAAKGPRVRYHRVGPNATASKDDVLLARKAAIDSWVQKSARLLRRIIL